MNLLVGLNEGPGLILFCYRIDGADEKLLEEPEFWIAVFELKLLVEPGADGIDPELKLRGLNPELSV